MSSFESRLESINLKLQRARAHLQAIVNMNSGYQRVDCRMDLKKDSEKGVSYFVVKLPDPPKDISTIVGDCLHNQRSSLDDLVWQMVESNPPNKPDHRNMFPICTSRTAYQSQLKIGRLQGIPEPTKDLINDLQPYDDPGHPLALLSKLHNADKHRHLNYAVSVASDIEVVYYRDGHPVFQTFVGNDEIVNGEIFGGIGFPIAFVENLGDVQVHGRAAAFLAFEGVKTLSGNTLSVADSLGDIQDLIEGLIFEFFSSFIIDHSGDSEGSE